MKIINISNLNIWPRGENKGMPSIFVPQKGLADRGHEIHFLCPFIDKDLGHTMYNGIHVYRFNFPFNFTLKKPTVYTYVNRPLSHVKAKILYNLNWFFFQIYGFFWLLKLSKKIRPDIIYAHSSKSAIPAWLACRIFSTKLIVRIYGLNWDDNLRYWIRSFRDYLVFKLPADYFIITNDGTSVNLLAKKLGVREERIKYWRNGVDCSMYDPDPAKKQMICKRLGIDPSAKIILFLSRLNLEKGADKLIYALPELFKKEHNSVCIVANDGPNKEELEKYINQNNISNRVFFLGVIDRSYVRDLLNTADVFVTLTKHSTCGNVMWEAMVCGKCIVSTENPGIKEILTHGKNGILISYDKIKELPQILLGLLNNDNLRNELGAKARMKAQEILGPWSKRVEKEAALLEELLRR